MWCRGGGFLRVNPRCAVRGETGDGKRLHRVRVQYRLQPRLHDRRGGSTWKDHGIAPQPGDLLRDQERHGHRDSAQDRQCKYGQQRAREGGMVLRMRRREAQAGQGRLAENNPHGQVDQGQADDGRYCVRLCVPGERGTTRPAGRRTTRAPRVREAPLRVPCASRTARRRGKPKRSPARSTRPGWRNSTRKRAARRPANRRPAGFHPTAHIPLRGSGAGRLEQPRGGHSS